MISVQKTYEVECGTDHFDSNFADNPQHVITSEDCIQIFDQTSDYKVAVFSEKWYYLKNGIGPLVSRQDFSAARCISGS